MGEVCEISIEETNKLREKLGLKKLQVEEEKQESGKNKKELKNDKQGKPKTEGTRRSKRLKEKQHNEEGNTIAEEYQEDVEDVEAWVQKTRKVIDKKLAGEGIVYSDEEEKESEEEIIKKTKKGKKKKITNDEKKKQEFVSNLKVAHKNEDIDKEIVLTLKDQSVLDENGEDCLINEDLKKENAKNQLLKKGESHWNSNFVDPLSYYEDNATINKKGNSKNENVFQMLPKYENDEEDKDFTMLTVRVTYKNEDKEETPTKEPKEETVLTNDEYAKNKNTSFMKLKKRNVQNIKKRKKEDAWDFLYKEEETLEKKSMNDSHKKKKKSKNTEQEKNYNEEEMKNNEEKDVDILSEVLKKIQEEQQNLETNYLEEMDHENEADKELYELLQKGTNGNKKINNSHKEELLKYVVINDNEKKVIEENKDTIIKLTDTSEFCKNIVLPTDLYDEKKNVKSSLYNTKNPNDEFITSKDILKEDINEHVLRNAIQEEIEEEEEKEGHDRNPKDDSNKNRKEESEEGVSKIFNEVEMDEGLFGALKYLKTKGELNIEEKIYRNPENRPLHMSTDKNEIKLDYKNETGKVMTPKETFRHISWIFHGKKQGKNKLEKKIKRMEIERRFKENPMDALPTMNMLKKYQETQKKSYFTLSNNE